MALLTSDMSSLSDSLTSTLLCLFQLAMRIGLHSGPVTGGVLRGDNARFQLFGDTARMQWAWQ